MPNSHNPLASARRIVVEGPIGVGKTSLARRLADHLQAELLLEDAQSNPFLGRFYRDRRRYALHAQLHFLFQRIEQVDARPAPEGVRRALVCDYLLEKDALFAALTLDDDEYALYRQVYDRLAAPRLAAVQPDLVIYLQAAPETLIERVRRRGIDIEQAIDDDYLMRVNEHYMHFFHNYSAAPVMVVNSQHLNFAESGDDFRLLVQRIETMRGQREYFNRGD